MLGECFLLLCYTVYITALLMYYNDIACIKALVTACITVYRLIYPLFSLTQVYSHYLCEKPMMERVFVKVG